jgi:ubiquinol-cytochrome c reductase iron-sulfur subunit
VLADISKIEPGQKVTFEWRGLPVFVVNRTKAQLDALAGEDSRLRDPKSENTAQQPAYAQNEARSIKPEWLVIVGICTHLGCVPDFFPSSSPSRSIRTGRAASIALATSRATTWPAASSKAFRRRRTSPCRSTTSSMMRTS